MGQVCITETSLIHEEWILDERSNDWSLDKGTIKGVVLNGMENASVCVVQHICKLIFA